MGDGGKKLIAGPHRLLGGGPSLTLGVLGRFPALQQVGQLVLPAAGAQSAPNRTGQSHRPDRPLEQGCVHPRVDPRDEPANDEVGLAANQHNHRQVGPRRLRVQRRQELLDRRRRQRFLGQEQRTRPDSEIPADLIHIGADVGW